MNVDVSMFTKKGEDNSTPAGTFHRIVSVYQGSVHKDTIASIMIDHCRYSVNTVDFRFRKLVGIGRPFYETEEGYVVKRDDTPWYAHDNMFCIHYEEQLKDSKV